MFNFFLKTAQNISNLIGGKKSEISKELLEEVLIESDVNYEIVAQILDNVGSKIQRNELDVALSRYFRGESYYDKLKIPDIPTKPIVELIFGVNGAGKTTTIAKLAYRYKQQGKKVLMGAGDTFRAAAIDQIRLWGERLGIDVVSTQYGSDPSALAFDAISAGLARKVDQVIIDTAGRLHNQTNLKNELLKISRVSSRALNNQPYRKILILDGTQGSSALAQAKIFHESLQIDGVIVTKLDGTSKGGALLSIVHALRLPIVALGVGEKVEDLIDFDEEQFLTQLLDSIFNK